MFNVKRKRTPVDSEEFARNFDRSFSWNAFLRSSFFGSSYVGKCCLARQGLKNASSTCVCLYINHSHFLTATIDIYTHFSRVSYANSCISSTFHWFDQNISKKLWRFEDSACVDLFVSLLFHFIQLTQFCVLTVSVHWSAEGNGAEGSDEMPEMQNQGTSDRLRLKW